MLNLIDLAKARLFSGKCFVDGKHFKKIKKSTGNLI